MKIVKEGFAEALVRLLARMADKQAAMFVATRDSESRGGGRRPPDVICVRQSLPRTSLDAEVHPGATRLSSRRGQFRQ